MFKKAPLNILIELRNIINNGAGSMMYSTNEFLIIPSVDDPSLKLVKVVEKRKDITAKEINCKNLADLAFPWLDVLIDSKL